MINVSVNMLKDCAELHNNNTIEHIRMNNKEKKWVIEQIGSITASNGDVYVKEMYKTIIPEDFPHKKIARISCKIAKKDLKQ